MNAQQKRVDWYFFSLLSNFSISYLQVNDTVEGNTHVFFESFYLSDVEFSNDTVKIQVYKNDYKLDANAVPNLHVTIDTSGGIWNQASSRLGRLQRRNVDFYKPHNENTYCPKNECE